jgi:two-component system sensor histidine kinase KdpD
VARRLLTGLAASIAAVAAVTAVVFAFRSSVPVLSLGVLYLFAVLPIAVYRGRVYAIGVAFASMLAFNFFFLPPVHTFRLLDQRDWFALAVYLVTAIVVSDLASRAREALVAERLRLSDSVKTAILRAVSHDLRSPLTAIRVAAESLASPSVRLSDEDRARQLDTVRHESARLDRLVSNLLDLSRLQAGAPVSQRELVSVDELVSQALSGLGSEGRVHVELPVEPPLIEVDPVQVERVLVNLIENALRYSLPETAVVVRVAPVGEDVVVRVVDEGPGIPAGELDRIFEPFQQLAGADGGRGTGLGLAIAHGFAEANGGRIWAESAPGRGASFAVAFPLSTAVVGAER